jgi:hypothetical protein
MLPDAFDCCRFDEEGGLDKVQQRNEGQVNPFNDDMQRPTRNLLLASNDPPGVCDTPYVADFPL